MSKLNYSIYSEILNTGTYITTGDLSVFIDVTKTDYILNDSIVINFLSPHNLTNGDKFQLETNIPSLNLILEVYSVLNTTSVVTCTKFKNIQLQGIEDDEPLQLDGSNFIIQGSNPDHIQGSYRKLTKIDIHPVNGQLVKFGWDKDKNGVNYSFDLLTDLIFQEDEYNLLKEIEEDCTKNCNPIYLEINKDCNNETFFKGKFTMRDADIDIFKCSMEIKVQSNTIYDCIEENKDEDVNLFDIVNSEQITSAPIIPSNLEFLFCSCPDISNPCNGEDLTTDGWELFLNDCGIQGGSPLQVGFNPIHNIKDFVVGDDYVVYGFDDPNNTMFYYEVGTNTTGAIGKPNNLDLLTGSLSIDGEYSVYIGGDLGFEYAHLIHIPTGLSTEIQNIGNGNLLRGVDITEDLMVVWESSGALIGDYLNLYRILTPTTTSVVTIQNNFQLPPSGILPQLNFGNVAFVNKNTSNNEDVMFFDTNTNSFIVLDTALDSSGQSILDLKITENHVIWVKDNSPFTDNQLKIYDITTGLITTKINSNNQYEYFQIRVSDCVNGQIFVSVSIRNNNQSYQYRYHSFDGTWDSGSAGTNQVVDGISETTIYDDLIGFENYSNNQNSSRYVDYRGYVLFTTPPAPVVITSVPNNSIYKMCVFNDNVITFIFAGGVFQIYDYEVSSGVTSTFSTPSSSPIINPQCNCVCGIGYATGVGTVINQLMYYNCVTENPNENVIFFREKITTPCDDINDPVLPNGGGWVTPVYDDNCSIDGTATWVRSPVFTPPTQYEVREVPCNNTIIPNPPDNTNNWFLITEDNGNWCINGIAYFWLIPSVSGTGVISYDNGMLFNEVLDSLFRYLCPEIKTVKSDFFAFNEFEKFNTLSNPNYLTNDRCYNFMTLYQKTDIKRPYVSGNSTIAEITLEDVNEWLKCMFEAYYFIDNGVLCIEHISRITSDIGIDLTDPKYNDFVKYISYKYDSDLPFKELFSFQEANSSDFFGKPIEYRYENGKRNLCTKGINSDCELDNLTTDISYLQQVGDGDEVDNEGFVLLSNEVDITTGALEVKGGAGIFNQNVVINNPLTWSKLHDNFKRHYRYLKSGYMNGLFTNFETSKPDIEYKKTIIPFCCDEEFNPTKKVKTGLGNGVVQKAQLDWGKKTLELNLKIEKC